MDQPEISPGADLATTLAQLPRSGADDHVTRLLDIYEAAERQYRAGTQAGRPVIGASTSSNL